MTINIDNECKTVVLSRSCEFILPSIYACMLIRRTCTYISVEDSPFCLWVLWVQEDHGYHLDQEGQHHPIQE